MNNDQDHQLPWDAFQFANNFRRAIRSFKPTPIPEGEIIELLEAASLAPSSGNLQPYEIHWIREPGLKAKVAQACNGQKSAASATDLIVVVASTALGKRVAEAQLAHVEVSTKLGLDSKAYHRKQVGMFQRILGLGSSAIWSPFVFLAGLIRPSLSLLPIGHIGSRQWAARNAMLAANTLMLGAAAKGIDSCPMEGFSPSKLTKLLGLPRGSVIPVVIALGYRAEDARIEDRWRRPIDDIIVSH